MKRSLFILVVLLCFLRLNAQDSVSFSNGKAELFSSQKPTDIRRLGIAAGVAYIEDGGIIGVANAEYNYSPKTSVGFTYGYIFEHITDKFLHFGLKYTWRNNYCQKGFYPFTGFSYGRHMRVLDGDMNYFSSFEFPLGANFVFKSGLQVSFQLSYYVVYDQGEFIPNFLQTPIGISYTTKYGLYASLYSSYFYDLGYSHSGPNFLIKLGWRINFRKRIGSNCL